MMGYEAFYTSLGLQPAVIHELMDRLLANKRAYWEKVLGEVGDLLDVVQEGDDLGTQTSLLISPAMYRTFIKPREKELFAFIRRRTDAKLFFHSCGAIHPLIPDLIEVGVGILNPVQFTASGMDARRLKREFGRDLVFWGGGIDTQHMLPYGSPQQIREAVRRQKETLSPGGGFVLAAVHNIQADVPPENLMAFMDEAPGL